MKTPPPPSIPDQARALLRQMKDLSEAEASRRADDYLSFFRTLHDKYGIGRSKSPRFSGTTFIVLEEVMYELEARPESTMRSHDFREFIGGVLDDIATGNVHVVPNPA